MTKPQKWWTAFWIVASTLAVTTIGALWGHHGLYLLWVLAILSSGFVSGYVWWKTFQLRKRHRIFNYFGYVKLALFIATLNSCYTLQNTIRQRGLEMFDNLTIPALRSLICQTLIALALWALALYLLGKINGDTPVEA